MNICIITHVFPKIPDDPEGSAGLFVFDFIKLLVKKGHNISILSPVKTGSAQFKKFKFQYFQYYQLNKPLGRFKIYNPMDVFKLIHFFIKSADNVLSFIRNNKIDRILCFWVFPSGYFALKSFLKFNIPYDVWALGSDINIYARFPVVRHRIKKILHNAQFIFADSPGLKNKISYLSKKTSHILYSCRILPERTNKRIYRQKDNVIKFIYIGRFEKIKGIDILIKAVIALIKEKFDFHLFIAGYGTMQPWMMKQIRKHSLEKFISYLVSISPDKMPAYLLKSSCIIIPSRQDSIPLVFSEALKTHTPVLSSDLPDISSFIDKYKIGMVFKKGDYIALKNKMAYLIRNKEKLSYYKKNINELPPLFDLNRSAAEYLSMLK